MSLHVYPVLAAHPSNPPAGVRLLYVLSTDNKLYYHNSTGSFDLTTGGVTAHDLGGAEHNADTLSNLNSKVTGGDLDFDSAPRDPNAHGAPAHTGSIGTASQISDFNTAALLRAANDWSAITSDPTPADTMVLLGERTGDGAKRKFTKAQLLSGISGGMPAGHITGLPAIWVSDSTLRIGPGSCRSDDDTTDIVVASNEDAAFGSTGAGGLDAGSESSSTGYYLWLIYDPTTPAVAAMLSESATAPTMPSGYTKKRLVGYGFNNASSNFWEFKQNGDGRTRLVMYNEVRTTTLRILSNGTATSWTDVDLSDFVPVNAVSALMMVQNTGTSVTFMRPDTFSSVTNGLAFIAPDADRGYAYEMLMVDTQLVEYQVVTGGSLTIDMMGYRLRI